MAIRFALGTIRGTVSRVIGGGGVTDQHRKGVNVGAYLEAYCGECREVRVLLEPEPRICCECDGVLEIHAAWNQRGE